eukprot:TRINITY_DN8785_c0_g1_i3.p2 TRINITY_DN8785_c0_g1~~TRINITY_DN8785_c0_g1_i3.p2  ORF type:complete len:313 (-),score=69.39 TRINITY_DN8785_c0_g1_i3:245-1183(-)
MNGGGMCTTQEACEGRTQSPLGSSTGWPSTMNLQNDLQTSNVSINPTFAGATQVVLPYCSGDNHSGNATKWGLHFSGHNIVKALIRYLSDNHGLADAKLLVLSGGSAGGMSVFYNADLVAAQLPRVRVLGVPIGGLIFPHRNYDGPGAEQDPEVGTLATFVTMAELYKPVVDASCVAALKDQSWQCAIPNVLYPFISTQLVVVESQTDSMIIFNFSDAPANLANPAVLDYVREYRANATLLAKNIAASPKDSIFSSCCYLHTGFNRGQPTIDNSDYYQAISAVAQNKHRRVHLLDDCEGLQCGSNCPPFPSE